MKTTLSRQHKMTRAIPAKKVSFPVVFPFGCGAIGLGLTNFYWLLENIESLDRMWTPRSETHVKVPVNHLQINMHCWCCITFIANNSIYNLLHRNANRTHHVEAEKWGIYQIHWHASSLLLNDFIMFKQSAHITNKVFLRKALYLSIQ